MKSSNRLIVAMLVVALLAGGFWILILSPKREKANELGAEVDQLRSSLILAEAQKAEATAARRFFPADYRKLVVLGKAIPGGDETSSLLIQLNRVAEDSEVEFESIQLAGAGGSAATTATAPEAGPNAPVTATTPPTEAAAALLPLGATVGSAGLAVMPYNLTFSGSFFDVADFIGGIDSLVQPDTAGLAVDGRLVTLDGFALNEATAAGFPQLDANFSVTTYLVPPGESVTAGATEAAPAEAEAAPTGTPSSFSTSPAQ
ncbi:MAG TPA: hypothetical protein VGO66_04145 [Solirubrobacterales bacterium]|nr:hypothetical protein [Solirubrobacterales bacterium]